MERGSFCSLPSRRQRNCGREGEIKGHICGDGEESWWLHMYLRVREDPSWLPGDRYGILGGDAIVRQVTS